MKKIFCLIKVWIWYIGLKVTEYPSCLSSTGSSEKFRLAAMWCFSTYGNNEALIYLIYSQMFC